MLRILTFYGQDTGGGGDTQLSTPVVSMATPTLMYHPNQPTAYHGSKLSLQVIVIKNFETKYGWHFKTSSWRSLGFSYDCSTRGI